MKLYGVEIVECNPNNEKDRVYFVSPEDDPELFMRLFGWLLSQSDEPSTERAE